tara:strand:+ start:157 stop:624 length:468 start_codon:yes stop_codon:yes gene_type:complete
MFNVHNKEHTTVDYNELLEHIYFKNLQNKRILIEVNSIKSTKELFKFCLDLFCKGLVLCHGDDTKRVEIDSLSMSQIQEVIDKLSYTGIMTIIQVLIKDPNSDEAHKDDTVMCRTILQDSVNKIEHYPDNDILKTYNFKIKVGNNIFCIFFDIMI